MCKGTGSVFRAIIAWLHQPRMEEAYALYIVCSLAKYVSHRLLLQLLHFELYPTDPGLIRIQVIGILSSVYCS